MAGAVWSHVLTPASGTYRSICAAGAIDQPRPPSAPDRRFPEAPHGPRFASPTAPVARGTDDGTLPDSGFGSSVGDASAGGLAAASASYDHLLLIGPALSGYFST